MPEFTVVDETLNTDGRRGQPGERVKILGHFDSAEAASEFITKLPDAETGRYGIDGPACEGEFAGRLEYLRGELRAGCISWSELAELQALAGYIEPGDTELLEAAGVPEHGPDD